VIYHDIVNVTHAGAGALP